MKYCLYMCSHVCIPVFTLMILKEMKDKGAREF